MCGIAGFSLTDEDNVSVDSRELASALLVSIEPRGPHATGAAWKEDDGSTWLAKVPVRATRFVTEYDHVSPNAPTAILHARWATKGSVEVDLNNHPIENGDIVGVHNGVLFNDDALFDLIGADKRTAEVDSEAVFAMLAHSTKPPTVILGMLDGSAAVAWYNVTDPDTLHLARVSSSPLVVGRTPRGSLLFASTENALRAATTHCHVALARTFHLEEGTCVSVRAGRIIASSRFTVEPRLAPMSQLERSALAVA